MLYYANGLTHKLEEETDGWWSIYRYDEYTGIYTPKLQAISLEKAKDYCDMCEVVPIKINKLIERR